MVEITDIILLPVHHLGLVETHSERNMVFHHHTNLLFVLLTTSKFQNSKFPPANTIKMNF